MSMTIENLPVSEKIEPHNWQGIVAQVQSLDPCANVVTIAFEHLHHHDKNHADYSVFGSFVEDYLNQYSRLRQVSKRDAVDHLLTVIGDHAQTLLAYDPANLPELSRRLNMWFERIDDTPDSLSQRRQIAQRVRESRNKWSDFTQAVQLGQRITGLLVA